MKNLFLTFLLLAGVLCTQAQNNSYISGGKYCSMRKSSLTQAPRLKSSPDNIAPHSFDVQNYKMNIKIYNNFSSPYPQDFNAGLTITIKVDTALNCIDLNAVNTSLQINGVGLAGTSFSHSNDILHIQLDRTYNPGEFFDVSINYSHKNVEDGAFYCKNGFVFTDCEPEGARKWFPCYDRPSDKATWELFAKVPTAVKLGSNGKLMDSTFNADTLTYHWKSANQVATYLVVITARMNYKLDIVYWHKISNPQDSVPIRFYYNPSEYPYTMEDIIGPMTTWFSQSFCEHPFEKNGFATLNSEFIWGGMENQTLTSLCSGCWSEGLLAHEFAHQWFGDMNTCATWADIWVNEGFAQWSEARWAEQAGGYSSYKYLIDANAQGYFQGIGGAPWAIYNPGWMSHTPGLDTLFEFSVTYEKGACALHQLRYILGDSVFFQVMQTYSNDSALKYNSATVWDFKNVVNEVTGKDYNWYFQDWLCQKYHPVYNNTYNIEDLGNGEWRVNYFTTQTQTNTGFFRMLQEIKIRFTDNTDTTFRVMNVANFQQYSWDFDKEPAQLQFDPQNEIVLKQGNTYVGTGDINRAKVILLLQNQPNPASDNTVIKYVLAKGTDVKLEILDMTGKVISVPVNAFSEAGTYFTEVNCSIMASGLYYYRITAGNQTETRKMVITH